MCWGVPAKVVKVEGLYAHVDFGGVKKQVLVGVEDIREGEIAVVHAGLIIGKIDEKSLAENLEFYREVIAANFMAEGLSSEEARKRAEEEIKKILQK
ncbi:MAG: HypC/HybG/HupF family hydrogenase formation chaperone [Candidatus Hadarchaeales archaeon]